MTAKRNRWRVIARAYMNQLGCAAALLVGSCMMPAHAVTLDDIQQQLAEHPVVRGDFEQERKMEMFSAPLVSSGHFVLAKEYGLHWQQTQPFPVSLVLTQDKLSQSFGGAAPEVIAAEQNPMVFYFSHLFLDLFRGETAQLSEQFELTFKGSAESAVTESVGKQQWHLVLTPKTAPLNAVFTSIELEGHDFIDRLVLTEKRGDITVLSFTNQSALPNTLTKDEQRAFDF